MQATEQLLWGRCLKRRRRHQTLVLRRRIRSLLPEIDERFVEPAKWTRQWQVSKLTRTELTRCRGKYAGKGQGSAEVMMLGPESSQSGVPRVASCALTNFTTNLAPVHPNLRRRRRVFWNLKVYISSSSKHGIECRCAEKSCPRWAMTTCTHGPRTN